MRYGIVLPNGNGFQEGKSNRYKSLVFFMRDVTAGGDHRELGLREHS